jgi:hypothetical protein
MSGDPSNLAAQPTAIEKLLARSPSRRDCGHANVHRQRRGSNPRRSRSRRTTRQARSTHYCNRREPRCSRASALRRRVFKSHRRLLAESGLLSPSLLRYFERIIDFDPQVADRALDLRVATEKLHGSEVLGSAIDQCRLRPSHRMRSVGRAIESISRTQRWTMRGVLTGRQVWRVARSTWEEVVRTAELSNPRPCLDRVPAQLGDLKLHGPPRLALHHH